MLGTIVSKAIAGLIVSLLVCFSVLLWFSTVTSVGEKKEIFNTNAVITSQFFASQIGAGTRLKRSMMVQPQISAVIEAEGLDISAIRVTHVEGVTVNETLKEGVTEELFEVFPAPQFSEESTIVETQSHVMITVPVMLGTGDDLLMVGEATAAWSLEKLKAQEFSFISRMVTFFAVGLIVSTAAIFIILNRVMSRPLRSAVAALEGMAGGDADVEIPESKSQETAAIAEALVQFRDGLRERERLEAERAKQAEAEMLRATANDRLTENLTFVADRAVKGDFSARMDMDNVTPEGQEIVSQINALLERTGLFMGTTTDILRNLAQKDLSIRMDGDFDGAFLDVQNDANTTIETLLNIISDLLAACKSARKRADDVTSDVRSLAQRVESQAASLQETTATADHISTGVKSNAGRLKDAENKVSVARKNVIEGRDRIHATTEAMSNIENGAGKITSIISVIDSISFQTNLLALNAAVEAARAGESGKGFAVVAAEVRTLAQRSSDAASDITSLINESTESVASGVELVAQTAASLDKIELSIGELASDIGDVATEGASQSQAIAEINQAMGGLDADTQANAAVADRMVTQMGELAKEMDNLEGAFSEFKLQAGTKSSVKAA